MRFIRPYGILWLSALLISILFAPQATAATQLPASGTSAPSVPKTTAAAIPSPFATLGRPVGVAATATALLVTQAQRKTVKAIDSAGNVTIFRVSPVFGRAMTRRTSIVFGAAYQKSLTTFVIRCITYLAAARSTC